MKKKIKNYFKNPMLIVFTIILIFFTPQAIYSPGQNRDKGVVIAVGIDRYAGQYEISCLTFIPTAEQSFKESSSVICGNGDTIAKALYNAQIAMGRKIGLSHAKTTVVNEELLKDDVSKYIDYLSRVASLAENTVFVCTDDSAKEILESSQSLVTSIGLQLEQIIGYDAKNLYVTDTSLEAFYEGYYSKQNASLIGYLSLANGKQTQVSNGEGQNQVDVQNQSNQGSDSQSQSTKQIVNQGEAVLLKGGKMVRKLSVDELNGINLLNPESINQIVTIDNVEENGDNLKLSFKIREKKLLTATKFENGYPIFSADLILGLELVEIEGNHKNLKVNTEYSDLTDEVKLKLDKEIKGQFTSALKILRECQSDVIGVTELFFKDNRKQFDKFIDDHGEEDNFINFVNFKLNLILQSD
jgi:Ger(x)C family germination protein